MCHLQELYAKYADKGLVVLGVNTADDKKYVVEMLAKDHVDFPNILDASDDANKAMDQYDTVGGCSAVPMTCVINRDGKVVDVWYGFDKGRTKKAVKKLNLKADEKLNPAADEKK
jgi:peroxiredoxin